MILPFFNNKSESFWDDVSSHLLKYITVAWRKIPFVNVASYFDKNQAKEETSASYFHISRAKVVNHLAKPRYGQNVGGQTGVSVFSRG
jgi:hypothetical protein